MRDKQKDGGRRQAVRKGARSHRFAEAAIRIAKQKRRSSWDALVKAMPSDTPGKEAARSIPCPAVRRKTGH